MQRENNNFDLLRLIAALMVIFGHSYALIPGAGEEPLQQLSGMYSTDGVAVKLFFFFSGLLIMNSLLRGSTPRKFVLMRVSRIWPALTVSVLTLALLVGPMISSYSIQEYFSNEKLRNFILANIVTAPIAGIGSAKLPGVFEGLPYSEVNGPMWTIPYEVACYVFALSAFLLISKALHKKVAVAFAILLLAANLIPTLGLVPQSSISYALLMFSLGCVASLFQNQIQINWKIAVALSLIAMMLRATELAEVSFYVAVCYGAVFVFTRPKIVSLKLPGDYSYGVYLAGWPVQNLLVQNGTLLPVVENLLVVMALSLVIAVFSWHVIEKPCLTFARKIGS